MAASHIFKVLFLNQGKVYEVYAKKVTHGSLFGFIEMEDIVFGERSSVVVDPNEERIKTEFEGVKRSFLPMHSVLRIDEVKNRGRPRSRLWRVGMSPRSQCRSILPRRATRHGNRLPR